MQRLIVPVVLILLALVPFSVRTAFLQGFFSDDAFIIHVYARNIAEKGDFAFNLGKPTLAVTCPLWVLLLSLVAPLAPNLPVLASTLGCLSASITILLMFFLMRRLGMSCGPSLCGSLLMAFDCWMLEWAGTGMETPFAVLLVTAFLYALWGARPGAARAIMLGGFSTLAWLVRPECGLLVLIAFAVVLIENGKRKKHCFTFLAPVLAIAMPWLVFAYTTFGKVTPNSLGMKLAGLHQPSGMIKAAFKIAGILAPSHALSVVVILMFIVWCLANKRYELLRKFAPALVFAGLLLAFYVINIYPIVSRYLLLLAPVWTASALVFLSTLLQQSRGSLKRWGVITYCVVFVLFNTFFFFFYIAPSCKMITIGMQTAYRDIGEWLNENTSSDARVALHDVGIIGYYARREIIDLYGLVTPEVKGQERIQLLKREKPEYAVLKVYSGTPPSDASLRLVTDWTEIAGHIIPGQGIAERTPFQVILYQCRWDD